MQIGLISKALKILKIIQITSICDDEETHRIIWFDLICFLP